MIRQSYVDLKTAGAHEIPVHVSQPDLWHNPVVGIFLSFLFFLSFFFFFWLFRAALSACGNSQARSQIPAAAARLHHSHSNGRFKLCLLPKPQLMAMARSLTGVRLGIKPESVDASWVRCPLSQGVNCIS